MLPVWRESTVRKFSFSSRLRRIQKRHNTGMAHEEATPTSRRDAQLDYYGFCSAAYPPKIGTGSARDGIS